MKRVLLGVAALAVLGACAPRVPDSGARVEPVQRAIPDVAPVVSQPLGQDPATAPLPSSITQAVNGPVAEQNAQTSAAAANSGIAPVEASPSNPAPLQVNNPGISDEQDFAAVSAERSIQSDAQRIAANRAQYTLISPTDLPTRPGTDQPNIVEYALRTSHPVGTQLYRRSGLRANRSAAACAAFPSPDQAQIEFLSQGGPRRDRRGLDPDGDGFACSWDPRPFRAARAAQPQLAPETAPASALVEPAVDLVEEQAAVAPAPAPTAPASAIVQPLVISSE